MPNWPVKTRDLRSHHFDSTVWDSFAFRDDDIVIATYAKSGTTWVQQIVGQLLSAGAPDVAVAELSPWLDLRVPPAEVKLAALEAQSNRRFIKTHLPVDALVYSPRAKYIYIGRDGRDVVWSAYNHFANANEQLFAALNDTPGRVGPALPRPPESVRDYFLEWLEKDGHPLWSFWENIRSWWAIRELPNMLLLHFNELKADLPGSIRRIADFLEIEVDEAAWPRIVEHCSFDWMKANATKSVPLGGAFWEGGAQTFINKGENGRWRDLLTAADNWRYMHAARAELGAECVHWLVTGERPAARRTGPAAVRR
jgi:aryl sulfotransferase